MAIFLCGVALVSGCERKAAPPAPEPPEVSISQPIQRALANHAEFTGRTDAIDLVEVRARVRGYLVKVNFKDGQMVKKGEVLYEIDPRPYQADLDKAQGEVAKAEGQKQLADIQVDRYTKLVAKSAASEQDRDEWRGKQAEAAGSVAAAKGQLLTAKLNLDFCTIRAPIDGQISRSFYQVGNLVSPDTTTLTTIVSVDPIYAYFNVDEPTFLHVLRRIREGNVHVTKLEEIPVQIGLVDDPARSFPLRGKIDFVNNQMDKMTATITVRGVFQNPGNVAEGKPRLLYPGMFTRVRVPLSPPEPSLLINERAIATEQGDKFVWCLDADNHVQSRRVQLGQQQPDGLQVVQSGLKAGDWVVVKGLQRCRPEAQVQPVKVDMITLRPTAASGRADAPQP
jgi:multidrug efflux system membrane fusion protein